jgi:hypothetical protein
MTLAQIPSSGFVRPNVVPEISKFVPGIWESGLPERGILRPAGDGCQAGRADQARGVGCSNDVRSVPGRPVGRSSGAACVDSVGLAACTEFNARAAADIFIYIFYLSRYGTPGRLLGIDLSSRSKCDRRRKTHEGRMVGGRG